MTVRSDSGQGRLVPTDTPGTPGTPPKAYAMISSGGTGFEK